MTALETLTVPRAEVINVNFNRLTSLDISSAVNLTELYCSVNALTVLDISQNINLTRLDCSSNRLRNLDLSANPALIVLRCNDNYLDVNAGSALWTQIQAIATRQGTIVTYEYQRTSYNLTITTPGMVFDEASSMLVIDTVHIVAACNVPASVFVEVNRFSSTNQRTYISSDTIIFNQIGMGTYSLVPPVLIGAAGDYAEIRVYANSSRARLIARHVVRPVLLM